MKFFIQENSNSVQLIHTGLSNHLLRYSGFFQLFCYFVCFVNARRFLVNLVVFFRIERLKSFEKPSFAINGC